MATYKFEQFNVEIVDPTVWADEDTIQLQVSKNTISVNIVLTTDNAKFGVVLDGFTYVDTWEDADIINWVNLELVKYEV